ncbi:hypothetical protein TI39_contig516g00008 [Zymoseptoria brevis]|uniref:Uncharacterized protein n=1 Tax=Zymoseptoria brevis TaxID=1047168 RepID=A0A0F4GJ35_9PEZI|nr:hypothetical protein TI39_contig516g00008 [Zymoseptoria brevis]
MALASRRPAADPDGQYATVDDTDIVRTELRTHGLSQKMPGEFPSTWLPIAGTNGVGILMNDKHAALTAPRTHSPQQAMPGEWPSLSSLSITDEAHAIPVRQKPQANLKGIAPELRISIYEALWIPKDRKYTIHTDDPERRVSQRQTKRSLDDIDRNRTALLCVDKQIYDEAVTIMHSNSTLGLWCMYGRMRNDTGAVWPVLYKFPTSSASAHITSVTLQVVLRPDYSIAFAPQGYPSMEKLQLVIKHDDRWWNDPNPEEAAISELVGKCSTNSRLKTVAVELVVERKYIAIHNDDDQNRVAAEQACDKVQKELEADFRLMRKSVGVAVLWSQGATPY